MEGHKDEREYYLRLTKDEIETIKYALQTQYEGCDNLNFDGSENDNLIAKINYQEDTIRRPYVVKGAHYHGMMIFPRRLVVMAEEPKWAIEYAKEHVEKEGGTFNVDVDSVHEMRDDEFIFAEDD
jgi:hypothetical protein